ncbi:electron transfer flavoprotein subunit alpha/FixB family protein [Sphingobacteriales bacterium UPWRP_1]|nr:electron transfer flavoprotein subunit alpha [Sphingobacteriales bacterium TSM_CSM]PSJ77832.1 electron transfer flavoprotein subunit alpha/FixB family protein [Sphingobacteriales bacterium UPWRP_1]
MSVLIYVNHVNGNIKKSTFETACYAHRVAQLAGAGEVIALSLGTVSESDLAALGNCGVSRVLSDTNPVFNRFDSGAHTKALAVAANAVNASVVVLSHNSSGKAIAPRLSVRLQAGLVSAATELPQVSGSGFTVRKSVFSGKAFADYSINTPVKIISLNPNSYPVTRGNGTAAVETFNSGVSAADVKVKVIETKSLSDTIPLPEAELVVSAGRGMKGPENWGMIEELASILGAATACSRPVADVHWRPHHEHVGQTGITIRPNLYIAIGISGAIQHLAGVSNSKVIVVINKDAEAPFFKAADYGIIGDAFEVVPKLTQALKEFKSQNA